MDKSELLSSGQIVKSARQVAQVLRIQAEKKFTSETEYKNTASNPIYACNLDHVLQFLNGIEIRETEFPDSISGMIKGNSKQAVIYVNSSHPISRKRFTIAHELGHFMLNLLSENKNFDFIEARTKEVTPDEIFSDEFAASLLMPEKLIRDFVQELISQKAAGIPEQVASAFNVSKAAAIVRLKNLSLPLQT